MSSKISCTLSAQENVFDFMDNLIKTVPEKSTASQPRKVEEVVEVGEGRKKGDSPVEVLVESKQPQTKLGNRRILKMKQQLSKQNNFIVDLKKKIREFESLKPKSISDQEQLAFLRNRLVKENDCLKKLLQCIIDEQKKDKDLAWERIRICSDPLDDICRNPWILGNVARPDRMTSIDSTLSSLSSTVMVGEVQDVSQGDVHKTLQKELMNRDRIIEILQSRIEGLTADVMKVRCDNEAILERNPRQTKFCEADMLSRLQFYKDNTDALERNLNQMGAALNVIRSELGPNLTGEIQNRADCTQYASQAKSSRASEGMRRSLGTSKGEDDQYNTLLKEYTKKSEECKNLTDRLAKSCSCENETPEKTELQLLKNRCSELLDEQEEFKILIKEQAEQLDEYRNKYLAAQQTVEEQNLRMEKMNVTNRRIEEQINMEIQRIKTKFQDKLRQLTPFPRLLDAEEQKVRDLRGSNEKLLEELKRAAKQIKSLENRLHNAHTAQNIELEKANNLLKVEVEQLTETMRDEESKREKLKEQLTAGQKELEEVRTETSKIIGRMNERALEDRRTAQTQRQTLEMELAQCRAAAAVTISNRDEALREMQSQIGVLAASFEDAQNQIRALHNQLAFMRNEQLKVRA
ncbi:myosin-11-like [Toxorhynchites rutilus septentrionalis]|uniref:myosin-11-like n=1 Tax=Toxorhynchites rutilus septentrionalis TaxID=329112 RepID=UPI00247B1464|nr:myosin-11-like [Toxorhynchites rutilus septentrionalis]